MIAGLQLSHINAIGAFKSTLHGNVDKQLR